MTDDHLPWQCFFSPGTLDRARRHFIEQQVRRVLGPEFGRITGAVADGDVEHLPVIRLVDPVTGPDQVLRVDSLESDCTCEREHWCSHAAAVIGAWCRQQNHRPPPATEVAAGQIELGSDKEDEKDEDDDVAPSQVAEDRGPVYDDEPAPVVVTAPEFSDNVAHAIQTWLRHSAPETDALATDRPLTFHFRSDGPYHWTCHIVEARRLKSGAWGVGKRFEEVSDALRLGKATAADQALLHRLHALDRGDRSSLTFLSRADADLIRCLLTTGRCYLDDFARPLRLGDAADGRLAWQEVPARAAAPRDPGTPGGWRLIVVDPHDRPLPVIPAQAPWYLAEGVCGPLRLPAEVPELAILLRSPLIPGPLLADAVARLSGRVPSLPPLPAGLTPRLAAPPTGHLVRWRPLVTWSSDRRRLAPLELLLLFYRYGDVLIAPQTRGPVRDHAGRPLLRDEAGEQRLLRILTDLGFVTLADVQQDDDTLELWRLHTPQAGLPWVHAASLREAVPGQPVIVPPALIAVLAATGWSFAADQAPPPALASATIAARVDDGAEDDPFSLRFGVQIGDRKADLTPALARLLRDEDWQAETVPNLTLEGRRWSCLVLDDGQVVRVPQDLLTRLLAHLHAIFEQAPSAQGWTAESWEALDLLGLDGIEAETGPRLSEIVDRLAGLQQPGELGEPPGFTATLRPYQRQGVAWMGRLATAGVGGVLADDMGLGKTVQAIAHLVHQHAAGRLDAPALVIGPASMVGTWRRELARFAPALRVGILHGADRPRSVAALRGRDVIITTYATALRDVELLGTVEWSVLIADEAQFIANPAIKSGRAVRGLPARQRLAMTGTPLSNHLGELHTLMHWLVPGLLGSAKRFERAFRKPIEKDGDAERAQILKRRVAPFLLRRTKELVAPELPPRTESLVEVEIDGGQKALYESVRVAMDKRIRDVVAAKGLARSRLEVLEALTALRLCCCDPRLVKIDGKPKVAHESAKLDWLKESLPELIEDGRRILLFSQFTSWLDLLEQDVLGPLQIPFLRLDGSTTNRDDLVQRFQAGEVPLFILSLKAGGTGLTLTAADTVILADPWWNSAAEAQAADRTHRIGQDKPVFVYRLVCDDTIEERVLAFQERKRALLASVLDADGQAVPSFTEADLADLLAPLPA